MYVCGMCDQVEVEAVVTGSAVGECPDWLDRLLIEQPHSNCVIGFKKLTCTMKFLNNQ